MDALGASDQPFPNSDGTVAPDPTTLWGAQIRRAPLPTNSPWLNFVLNRGSCPEYLHPYIIQSSEDGKLSVCYPTRGPNPDFIFQCFVPNLSVSCQQAGPVPHVVSQYDDLSVTLNFSSKVTVPLVRGSPYVTFLFRDATPVFTTIHAILQLHSNDGNTRHRVVMNNGQTWVIYCSSPLALDQNLNVRSCGADHYTGVVRIALVPSGNGCSSILDRFSTCYPVGGLVDLSVPFQIKYVWKKKGWGDLLMLSLPYHLEILAGSTVTRCPLLSYQSIDGSLEGVLGDSWILQETPISISWYSSQGVRTSEARTDILCAIEKDIDALTTILNPSTYFHGKALARAARLALIAEEIGNSHLVDKVRKFLVDSITPWFQGTFAGNALVYDAKWGGIVSREGARDAGADFGLAMYNDHHYHHGYFCYAGAVLAKLDQAWGRAFKSYLYALVRDFMNLDSTDEFFPRLRCYDPWTLHSWAGGLTEFADGRNQESTSEAINAYYSAALVGYAYGDPRLINLGLTLTALEIRASRSLWHVKCSSTLYEPEFVKENRVVGVLWANKRDSGLWFAPKDCREMRLGIQVLPISPITEFLFQDVQFVEELVEWTLPVLTRAGCTDAWRGFVYALLALFKPQRALQLVHRLTEHDDGNTLSNLLWWIYTRP